MAMRPQNMCQDCSYTWYPRGKNVSLRCPRCGSGAVTLVPISLVGLVVVAVLVAVFGVLFVCGGLLSLVAPKPRPAPEEQVAKPPAKSKEPTPDPLRAELPPRDLGAPPKPVAPPGKAIPTKTAPRKEELPPAPAPIEPVLPLPTSGLETAPAPRQVPLNRPPDGFASKWDRCGDIETRVVGAIVMRPMLTKDRGEDLPAPEPMLLIWVETRSLPAGRIALSRWQGTFNDAVELTSSGGSIAPADIPSGHWLGGQLRKEHSLKPGGTGVVDTLAFKIPPSSAGDLRLRLRAQHVKESGAFVHLIPRDVWDQKRR